MSPDYTSNQTAEYSLRTFLSDFVVVNRLPETLGYNIIYFIVGVGLLSSTDGGATFYQHADLLVITFFAVMLSKMQASVADAIHDYTVDKENPNKSFIAAAVDSIGKRPLFTILIVELVAGIGLWGWLSLETNMPFFLWVGVGSSLLGFIYSYPPRIKEQGILNHIVTTGVDVVGVVLPAALVTGAVVTPRLVGSLLIVFLYAFAYHVMHQAADTVYDRECGVSTFTRSIGISESVWLAALLTGLAAVLALLQSYLLSGVGLCLVAAGYTILAKAIEHDSPPEKCDRIARWFRIGPWAVGINCIFALSLYL